MGKNIEVRDYEADKNSNFNVKKFELGSMLIDRPTKIIDARNLTPDYLNNKKKMFKHTILTTSKFFYARDIQRILVEPICNEIKKKFGFKQYFSQYPYFMSVTFQFNPFKTFKKIDQISGFFKYYYQYSNLFLLVPNIRAYHTVKIKDPNTGKMKSRTEPIISTGDYINFVNEAYKQLEKRNSKKILVPVSLKFGIDEYKKLAKDYIKNEHLGFWFDFESAPIIGEKCARINMFLTEVEKIQDLRDIVVYSTNMKRELISNINFDQSPSSDILASLVGSNLVGIDKEPIRYSENKEPKPPKPDPEDIKRHKARIFNRDTYYYDKPKKEPIMDKMHNTFLNSSLLDKELISQTDYFWRGGSVEKYITKKPMIINHNKGELIRTLFPKQKKITKWF